MYAPSYIIYSTHMNTCTYTYFIIYGMKINKTLASKPDTRTYVCICTYVRPRCKHPIYLHTKFGNRIHVRCTYMSVYAHTTQAQFPNLVLGIYLNKKFYMKKLILKLVTRYKLNLNLQDIYDYECIISVFIYTCYKY